MNKILSGEFHNCYGLHNLVLPDINFDESNCAVIYAPNGVMKSSFAKVFLNIIEGEKPKDLVFSDLPTSLNIKYCDQEYKFDSNIDDKFIQDKGSFFVIKSYVDNTDFNKEAVSLLVADEKLKHEYDLIVKEVNDITKKIQSELSVLSGYSNKSDKLLEQISNDFSINIQNKNWVSILKFLSKEKEKFSNNYVDVDCKISDIFNDKTQKIFKQPAFLDAVGAYITNFENLLQKSKIFTKDFSDINVTRFSKPLKDCNFFVAGHKILLSNTDVLVDNIDRWNDIVNKEMEKIYGSNELKEPVKNLQNLFAGNEESRKLCELLQKDKNFIGYLADIPKIKKQIWIGYLNKLSSSFDDIIQSIEGKEQTINELYDKASLPLKKWERTVDEFNRRFKVPFKVRITNQADLLLKGKVPTFEFSFTQINRNDNVSKQTIDNVLSTGEKHALYLLNEIFKITNVINNVKKTRKPCLVIADDIADSFDYKNKYAIIEYMLDISKNENIHLLFLTHNFDFYRTIHSRLGIKRENCLIAQKNDKTGEIVVKQFQYLNDAFKNVLLKPFCSSETNNKSKSKQEKFIIAGIPFYRNIAEYLPLDDVYSGLTCCLHIKTMPLQTEQILLKDVYNLIKKIFPNFKCLSKMENDNYLDSLFKFADDIVKNVGDETLLENKEILAIAIRLKTEFFLNNLFCKFYGIYLSEVNGNQTREWYESVKLILDNNSKQKEIVEKVMLITPEAIHLNAFMYEPLIDISNWALVELYKEVKGLYDKCRNGAN